uniref:Uncharacterized protein n=1 Tax=Caenorhabditis japonica TaxID=281687 RepID=A0A8R1IYT1_CAEJA
MVFNVKYDTMAFLLAPTQHNTTQTSISCPFLSSFSSFRGVKMRNGRGLERETNLRKVATTTVVPYGLADGDKTRVCHQTRRNMNEITKKRVFLMFVYLWETCLFLSSCHMVNKS